MERAAERDLEPALSLSLSFPLHFTYTRTPTEIESIYACVKWAIKREREGGGCAGTAKGVREGTRICARIEHRPRRGVQKCEVNAFNDRTIQTLPPPPNTRTHVQTSTHLLDMHARTHTRTQRCLSSSIVSAVHRISGRKLNFEIVSI